MQSFQREDSQFSQAVPSQVQINDGQEGAFEAASPLQLELCILSPRRWLELVTKQFLHADNTVIIIIFITFVVVIIIVLIVVVVSLYRPVVIQWGGA